MLRDVFWKLTRKGFYRNSIPTAVMFKFIKAIFGVIFKKYLLSI